MCYSEEASQLCSVFTAYRNTINVYTEDQQRDTKFYVTLLKRLLEGTDIEINDVIPLGSCKDVMDACSKDTSSAPKIYIVDGDIDLMATPKPTQQNLFVLERYCIENYVVDEKSVHEAFNELDCVHDSVEIAKMIDYQAMINSAVIPMTDLFRHFAMSKRIQGVFTLKNFTQIAGNQKGSIDLQKVDKEKSFVITYVKRNVKVADEIIKQEIEKLETQFPSSQENFFKYVSGKDYIIPYVTSYCCGKLNQSLGISKENWKYQFAKYCDLAPLETLKNAIVSASHAQSA